MSDYDIVGHVSDRQGWLRLRREGIGSSDAPGILGVSPFQSPLAVYADKLGLKEDDEQSEAMKWGTLLEPLILSEFGAETERAVKQAGELLRSRDVPWLQCTLDGEEIDVARGGLIGQVEAKATGWRAGDWSEGIPEHVMVQVQHAFAVTGREWGSVVVLLNGCRLLWADVERDQPFIDEVLMPAEAEFWRRVQAREPVDPDGSKSSAEALKWLYPTSDPGAFVTLPGDFVDLDRERCELKARIADMASRVEVIDQLLKAEIGSSETGYLANGVIYTHKRHERKGYTVAPTSYRQLRRKAPPKGE